MKKRLVIALALLVLFSTYKSQKFFLNNQLNIEEIEIKIVNNFILKDENIKKELAFLYNMNLVFLKTFDVKEKLKKIDFIKSFEIKKIYPKKIIIKIYEKKPIAILEYKKKKFFISEQIELINYRDIENYKDLPKVVGNKERFKTLYKDLKKINFPLDLITGYYFYESKRWNLEIRENIIIKLPSENYIISLKNFMKLTKENNFDKYKVFDYRISNQLILK